MPLLARTRFVELFPPIGSPWKCQACQLRLYATSSSSKRWLERQRRDSHAKEAQLMGLKTRAAIKLLELNQEFKIFKKGQTVVDLGYAPGSWSQVAVDRTSPGGRVLGVDIIPALPPKGVSAIQGNFLSPAIQASIKEFLSDPNRGRQRESKVLTDVEEVEGYVDRANHEGEGSTYLAGGGRSAHVVLSDMSDPWELSSSDTWKRVLTDPYNRLMNTSGIGIRDHIGSMDLCYAVLLFCLDVLMPGGTLVCKFYQGAEDKKLENNLRRVFEKVHRNKPESSRKESKEMYFVALKLNPNASISNLQI